MLGKLLVRLSESSLITSLFQDRASKVRQSHKGLPPQSNGVHHGSRLAIAPDFTLAEEGLVNTREFLSVASGTNHEEGLSCI